MRTLSCFAFASLRLKWHRFVLVVGAAFNPSLDRGIHVSRDHIWRFAGDTPFPSGPIMPLGRPFNQIASKLRQYQRGCLTPAWLRAYSKVCSMADRRLSAENGFIRSC
jgi:hypothetical protein